MKLVVPPGATPGMLLTFQVPKGAKSKKQKREEKHAVTIQAHLRGRADRRAAAYPGRAHVVATMAHALRVKLLEYRM